MASSPTRPKLTDSVYQHLFGQLVDRQITIGTRINARHVADDLAVSRTTVNKALERLTSGGWVRADAGRHLVVVDYPPKTTATAERNFEFANQTDNAYEALLERILRGELQPGEIVKERPWAGLLGINPATVRRAAEWLHREGLLIRLPRRGWRVALLDVQDLKNIYDIRLLLEPLAIPSAVQRISEKTLDDLEAEAQHLIDAGQHATVYQRRQSDHHFHRALCEASGNRTLTDVIDPLVRRVLLVTTVSFHFGRAVRSSREHLEILAALRRRDADLAIKRLKAHLRSAMKFNVTIWERH